MALPMTDLPGVPSRDSIKEGMAHFSNTGPFATFCGECKFRGYFKPVEKRNKATGEWESVSVKTGGCAKYLELTGKFGPPVNKMWASCRYFERPNKAPG